MVKQYISAVLEDLLGEYVLNISKENLKLAALRGKIKLDKVELDGDFIGSHILGAVGLAGFGVLSCWAHSLQISIPWTNLDEPTRLEVRGMHLVCVPLLPTTATRIYYGGGSSGGGGPSCSLRTRAKRSALARFERNFFSGRIPGEGPQKDEGDDTYNGRRCRWSANDEECFEPGMKLKLSANETSIESSISSSFSSRDESLNSNKDSAKPKESSLPAFKRRITTKIYENLVCSFENVHIRFEVPEGGLGMSLIAQYKPNTCQQKGKSAYSEKVEVSDQKAFSFGLTLKSLTIRNVSEELGANRSIATDTNGEDSIKSPLSSSERLSSCQTISPSLYTSESKPLSDGEYRSHKNIELQNLSIYWDDGPSFLISESELLKGTLTMAVSKCQERIAAAMEKMSLSQDPGHEVKSSLSKMGYPSRLPTFMQQKHSTYISHDYICSNFSQSMSTTFTSRISDSLYFIEILPCVLDINISSQQYRQYQRLKNAVLSQQRFDTMLHRRPYKSIAEDPKSWWRYAIACVKHNPTARPWKDVQKIVRCRKKYIELVMKNLSNDSMKSGFHGGLTDQESQTLTELEDLLPIETLLAFHIIALRKVFVARSKSVSGSTGVNSRRIHVTNSFSRKRSTSSLGRLWHSMNRSSHSWQILEDDLPKGNQSITMPSALSSGSSARIQQRSVTSSKSDRLSPPVSGNSSTYQTTCKFHLCNIRISLLQNVGEEKIVSVEIETQGTTYNSGTARGKLTFDVTRFEVFDFITSDLVIGSKVLAIAPNEEERSPKEIGRRTIIQSDFIVSNDSVESVLPSSSDDDDLTPCISNEISDGFSRQLTPKRDVKLPPDGVVCRVTAIADETSLSLFLSSHPATLVWNKACADSVADFFLSSTPEIQSQFLSQLQNAATPLAYRSHIALLYPTALCLSIDVHAPKLWIPVSSSMIDGSLFVDAGKFKMSLSKPQETSETKWNLDVSDIQIKFAQGASGSVIDEKYGDTSHLDAVSKLNQELVIVQPFQIILDGETTETFEAPTKNPSLKSYFPSYQWEGQPEMGIGNISATVSKIRLNLVDVEKLAKAIGRFYATEMVRMKEKSDPNVSPESYYSTTATTGDSKIRRSTISHQSEQPSLECFVVFEKIELALESYAPQQGKEAETTKEHRTSHSLPRINRTYLVEVLCVKLQNKSKGQKSFSRLTVSNASIVQLIESDHNQPNVGVRYLKPSREPQHQILERKHIEPSQNHCEMENHPVSNGVIIHPETPKRLNEPDPKPLCTPKELRRDSTPRDAISVTSFTRGVNEFIRSCHFHDGENHLDEIEFDISPMIIRVTPTSIMDCTNALRRFFELIQLTSREMERKVHEAGRKARTRMKRTTRQKSALTKDKSISLASSSSSENKGNAKQDQCQSKKIDGVLTDSAIIFRATFEGATVLVGRPGSEFISIDKRRRNSVPIDYVVQLLTNASILIQSVENQNPDIDGMPIGSKTAHISLEKFSASTNANFQHVELSDAPPMLSPIAIDFRAVYQTESEGNVVFQDFSCDCESIKLLATPYDIKIVESVARKVMERLQLIRAKERRMNHKSTHGRSKTFLPAFMNFRKKGSGIATRIRAELQEFSLVILRSLKSKSSTRSFFDFSAAELKAKLEGCEAALTGELSAIVTTNFFNPFVVEWENVLEPFHLIITIDQMPNDIVIAVSSSNMINVNVTGVLLSELANINYSRKNNISTDTSFDSNLAVRSESKGVKFTNLTGIELTVGLSDRALPWDQEQHCQTNQKVSAGDSVSLDHLLVGQDLHFCTLTLSARDRQTLCNLPLTQPSTSQSCIYLHKWHPCKKFSGDASDNKLAASSFVEPVVEFVLQNQRLRHSVVDVFSLERGQDLLSSNAWSPESNATSDVLWLPPYLEGDVHEWSDMTCTFQSDKDLLILPDNSWIWANSWDIEIEGELGIDTDADGWEYSSDFETFSNKRRFYKRGDSCRRRRWTRTRLMKPPPLDSSMRVMPIVWETKHEENGYVILARSHFKIQNNTFITLSIFASCDTWEKDEYVGSLDPGKSLCVPIRLSSATHIRLAIPKKYENDRNDFLKERNEFFVTNPLMILPTGFTSSRVIRTSIICEQGLSDGFSSLAKLHFLLKILCVEGVLDINIHPALTVINLLPCLLQCQFGESVECSAVKGRKIVQTEEMSVDIGKEAECLSVDCSFKPHISVRVPGYRWSEWKRIVNRSSSSFTWRASEEEEVALFEEFNDGTEHSMNEHQTIVHLDHKCAGGDSVNIIMGIEMNHSPVIRIFAQFWILDKTGFGLKFTEAFSDLRGTAPDTTSLRKSFMPSNDAIQRSLHMDIQKQGHEWSLGMNGMSLFFSQKEKIALSIECGAEDVDSSLKTKSKWTSLMDISKVMPTTVLSVDEYDGSKRFELSFNVSLCSSMFSCTRLITIFPRFQIVNLLQGGLYVAQDGALDCETFIPAQSWVPFHWEKSFLPSKIRIALQSSSKPDSWSRGCIQLDKIGITAMRVPSSSNLKPVVVQTEVRLATKKQSSAVVVVIWSSIEKSSPLYLLKNHSTKTVFCCQPLVVSNQHNVSPSDDISQVSANVENNMKTGKSGALIRIASRQNLPQESAKNSSSVIDNMLHLASIECGAFHVGSDNNDNKEEFIWVLQPGGDNIGFGFCDPEMPHVLEWTCTDARNLEMNGESCFVGSVEVDAMGSSSIITLRDGQEVKCEIKAELSTKVILFSDIDESMCTLPPPFNDPQIVMNEQCEDELISASFRVSIPGVVVSVIDNTSKNIPGKEILLLTTEKWRASFSQSREGFHELEVRLKTLHLDNFIFNAEHPVLIFTPNKDKSEPFLHISAVRRLQEHNATYVFSYVALRILEMDLSLDRKTAEAIAKFLLPLRKVQEENNDGDWIISLTSKMSSTYSRPNRRAPGVIEKSIHTANSGRIYLEQLHLHPIRISFTFTQQWTELNPATEGLLLFQIIQGMASIANAPLTFTSFVVSHAFESPHSLAGIVLAHYSSQLTSQMFTILGSLAILKAPANFLANIGTGVRDFFYEPINGLVQGPAEFLEGLEHGTQSLARGVFIGFVMGAANVTELVSHNLAGLTSDDVFIDERNAYHKQLMRATQQGTATRTIQDSLNIAGACVARGFKSGFNGFAQQPIFYASRHGAVGLVKGVGKALLGAIVKPVVGVGDAAVVVMNHVSEATSETKSVSKVPKRMRRALPLASATSGNYVKIIPYEEISAKAQKIVTGAETVDDDYLGHVQISSHLIIASNHCLWVIDKKSREPWCIGWAEISHFGIVEGNCLKIDLFSQQGLHSHVFETDPVQLADFYSLLSLQVHKMGSCSFGLERDALPTHTGLVRNFHSNLPGIKAVQTGHIFGSSNKTIKVDTSLQHETELIERCHKHVNKLGSFMPKFFRLLDQESWNLVNSWNQMNTGLSSRRCVLVGIINGTLESIQIKSAKIIEGGSPCFSIPTTEYDSHQGILHSGGAVIFFGWGAVPSLLQTGKVLISIESNIFLCNLADRISQSTNIQLLPGYQIGFLEKSFDENGWWAKYWILIGKKSIAH